MKRKWVVWVAALQLIILMQVTTAAQKLIDLEFNGARVQDVLQVLRRLGDFNIVADPQVTGEVTIFLKQVTAREAVGLVAQAAGYSYRFQGNTVHIATEQRLEALFSPSAQPASAPEYKVYNLQSVDAAQAVAMLSRMLPGVNAVADDSRNLLVLSASSDQLRRAEALLFDFDRRQASSRPLRNVDVINLNHADPEQLANVIRAIEPNATVTVDAFTRSLVVRGSDRTIASVRSMIPLLDTIQRQVLVEARLVEISLEALNRLGLTWDLPSFALSLERGASLSITSEELGIALEALSTEGSAHILANPKIAAVNATTATFLIGDRIPIMMQQADDLGRVTGFLEFIEAGISLAITPIIGDDGFVTLELTTGVSGITGMTPQNIPQIRTREVTATVRVQDGQPLVIGGLIQEEDRVTVSGIPLLQKFPLIGELFRRRQSHKVQSETVIFLTPHIVTAAPKRASSAPAQQPGTDSQSPQAAVSSEVQRTTSAGGDQRTTPPGGGSSKEPTASRPAASPPSVHSKTGDPVAPARTSISLDIGLLVAPDIGLPAARTVDVELESGAATRFLTRFHVTPSEDDVTWGFGLGLRRFLAGTLWADIGGEHIVGPDSQGTAWAASAQLGIRVPLGKRIYLDPHAGYRHAITSEESATLFGRTEGVYGSVRFGW